MKALKSILALILALTLLATLFAIPALASAAPDAEPPAATEDEADAGLDFHPESFVDSLQYMGTGMIGIFLVIGIIVLCTVVLNKVFSKAPKDNE